MKSKLLLIFVVLISMTVGCNQNSIEANTTESNTISVVNEVEEEFEEVDTREENIKRYGSGPYFAISFDTDGYMLHNFDGGMVKEILESDYEVFHDEVNHTTTFTIDNEIIELRMGINKTIEDIPKYLIVSEDENGDYIIAEINVSDSLPEAVLADIAEGRYYEVIKASRNNRDSKSINPDLYPSMGMNIIWGDFKEAHLEIIKEKDNLVTDLSINLSTDLYLIDSSYLTPSLTEALFVSMNYKGLGALAYFYNRNFSYSISLYGDGDGYCPSDVPHIYDSEQSGLFIKSQKEVSKEELSLLNRQLPGFTFEKYDIDYKGTDWFFYVAYDKNSFKILGIYPYDRDHDILISKYKDLFE